MAETVARSLRDATPASIAEAMNLAYCDYLVPLSLDATAAEQMVAAQDIDLGWSSAVLASGEIVAIALIARRGSRLRLAAIGCAPRFRRRGLARGLLLDATAAARRDGFPQITLEVFEANDRAMPLYCALGFEPGRRLLGFARDASAPDADLRPRLRRLSTSELIQALESQPIDGEPWQFEPTSIAKAAARYVGWSLSDRALAVASLSGEQAATLRYFSVQGDHRDQGLGQELLN